MPLNFPLNPISGDEYTINNKKYIWDGYVWNADPTVTASVVITDHTELDNIGTNTHDQIDAHILATNPHNTTKTDIGLGQVDNTSDADKPVSTATATAISILQSDVDSKISVSEKGQVDGVATLDSTGKVPSMQLPSYVDDVQEYADFASLPATGESGKIYLTTGDNSTYRWSGTAYIQIGTAGNPFDQDLDSTSDVTFSTVNGRDLTTDGTKLDGIEVGATADQTKADIDSLGINAASVNSKTVETSVPAGAVFTDTVYDDSDVIKDADVLTPVTLTNKIVTQDDVAALGGGDMLKSVYDTTDNGKVDDADLVNGLTVETAVPANAVFTDTLYDDSNVLKDSDSLSSVTASNKLVTQTELASVGSGDMEKAIYDTTDNGIVDNSELVNGLTVETAVPVGAVFTDTTYTDAEVKTKYETNTDTNAFTDIEKTKLAGIDAGAEVNIVTSVATKTGDVVLTNSDVGLSNVDNTSDLDKPISTATQIALDGKQNILSEGTFVNGDKTKLDGIESGAQVNTVDTSTTTNFEKNVIGEQYDYLNVVGDLTIDLGEANHFYITLAGDFTLQLPSNVVEGQTGIITIVQDATGSRLLSYTSDWEFQNGTPVLSTDPNAIDKIFYQVMGTTTIHSYLVKGV